MESNLGSSGGLFSSAFVLNTEYHLSQSVSIAWGLKYTLQNLLREADGALNGRERNFIH